MYHVQHNAQAVIYMYNVCCLSLGEGVNFIRVHVCNSYLHTSQ